MGKVVLIVHDIRSTHNVGALLRTAECLGVKHVYFTGYTPYPVTPNDDRLPYIAAKLTKQIEKTALGTETMVAWSHEPNVLELMTQLKQDGFTLIALEQHPTSIPLNMLDVSKDIALLIGREVEGIAPELLGRCDTIVEIPQLGKKKSLNVVQATAIALYHCSMRQ